MLNVKRSTLGAVCAAALALGLAMGLAACAPKTADSVKGSSSGSSAATSQVAGDGTGAYVSDEQCLSCHGGSYEALAEKTADYGDSNPHLHFHIVPKYEGGFEFGGSFAITNPEPVHLTQAEYDEMIAALKQELGI